MNSFKFKKGDRVEDDKGFEYWVINCERNEKGGRTL